MTASSPYCCSVKGFFFLWSEKFDLMREGGPSCEASCQGCNSECSNDYGRSHFTASNCVCWFSTCLCCAGLCILKSSLPACIGCSGLYAPHNDMMHQVLLVVAKEHSCGSCAWLMAPRLQCWSLHPWIILDNPNRWGCAVEDCSTRLDDSSGICFRENVYNTLRTYALHQSEAFHSSDTLVVPVDHTTVPIVGINLLMNHLPVQ